MKAAALALLLATGARATPPFQDLTYAEAKARAKAEKKLLFVDVVSDGCGPCEIMRRVTYKSPEVLAWLAANAVSIEPNTDRVPKLKADLGVDSHPTLILFDSKGRELDRTSGLHYAPELLQFLKGAAAGGNQIDVLRAEIATTTTPLRALELRLLVAQFLSAKKRDREALDEYLWLYDHGPDGNDQFRYMTQGTMLYKLVKLSRRYPPAAEALEKRREAAWKELSEVPSSTWTARAVVMIDSQRGQRARTDKDLDALSADDPRRPALAAMMRLR